MSGAAASPFSTRALLAVLGVGAAAFLLLLYAIGAGWTGNTDRNGGAHAAANGLNGFAGLVRLLEARGHEVSLSRSAAELDTEGLLIVTPQHGADVEELDGVISGRRYTGSTLVILPKWFAVPADQATDADVPRGWVALGGALPPEWAAKLDVLQGGAIAPAWARGWRGMGRSGALPDAKTLVTLKAENLVPLVRDDRGRPLAGFVQDGGTYPVLAEAASAPSPDSDDPDRWAVVMVAEPDLLNNYGLADRRRAELAVALVEAALEGQDIPIVFDLSIAGLGQADNLLTLAFRPPFLAATLCLLLAALVIAWRGLRRFGPPLVEAPALAMGKRQLAENSAALVERARRVHLLGPPYAALVAARLAALLGIRDADPEARDAAIARALAERGLADDYSARAEALRRARKPAELLRAAGALKTLERTVPR